MCPYKALENVPVRSEWITSEIFNECNIVIIGLESQGKQTYQRTSKFKNYKPSNIGQSELF